MRPRCGMGLMAAKKRRSRKDKPAEWPTPRPRPHTPAADVRTGKGAKEVRSPKGGAVLIAGGHPKNTGGKKGRSGRKPRLFKEFCQRVIESPAVQDQIARRLMSPHTKTSEFTSLVVGLAGYVVEKPKQSHEHSGRLTLEDLVAGSYSEGDGADTGDDAVDP